MRLDRRSTAAWLAALSITTYVTGCVLAPAGMREEEARLDATGSTFEPRIDQRRLPELPTQADWRDLLHYAFLANGELENAYFEWKAAMQRVDMAAGYPNTNVSLGFEYMFSGDDVKAWDRSTLSVGFDPMQNLSFPTKVMAAGKVALEDARATAARFRAVKFDVQRRVLSAYWDFVLAAERQRLQAQDVDLLSILAATARARVEAGGMQPDLLATQVAVERAANELGSRAAEVTQQRAMLNAVVGRSPDAPLDAPDPLPPGRSVSIDDARLLAFIADGNPEIEQLSHAAASRELAVAAARQRYLPDINPFVGITGNVSQVVGAAITLSTMLPQIHAAIEESRAMQRGAEAMLRQGRLDRGAALLAALAAWRNSERQLHILEDSVLPALLQSTATLNQGYASSTTALPQLVESRRLQIEVRMRMAELRAAREQRLADIEALVGIDLETLNHNHEVALHD